MAMRPIRGYKAENRYPDSEHKLRHLFRNRHENGLAPAFVKVGSRVLFDPERLDSLLANHGEHPQANAAA
jgi:hypothetical protein